MARASDARLSDARLDAAAAALGATPERDGTAVRLALADAASGRRLLIDVLRPDGDAGAVVKAYGTEAHLELHDVSGLVSSDDLGEVIFFARAGGRVSGLVVERGAACSLFAGVDEALLSADFLTLPPHLAQAAVVLSLAEPLFDGDWAPDEA